MSPIFFKYTPTLDFSAFPVAVALADDAKLRTVRRPPGNKEGTGERGESVSGAALGMGRVSTYLQPQQVAWSPASERRRMQAKISKMYNYFGITTQEVVRGRDLRRQSIICVYNMCTLHSSA